MNFGDLKQALRGIINRKDLNDQLAGSFVNRGIKDLERLVRFGAIERVSEFSAWNGTSGMLKIPTDYLELIDLYLPGRQLLQVDKAQLFALRDTGQGPQVFTKLGDSFLLKPAPAPGTVVFLHHYAETRPLQTDTDSNIWTLSCFNAALYTAATLAADFFQMEDEYAQRFGAKASAYVEAIIAQDLDEKWAGPLNISRPQGQGDY
jgi:hypothetical protein